MPYFRSYSCTSAKDDSVDISLLFLLKMSALYCGILYPGTHIYVNMASASLRLVCMACESIIVKQVK